MCEIMRSVSRIDSQLFRIYQLGILYIPFCGAFLLNNTPQAIVETYKIQNPESMLIRNRMCGRTEIGRYFNIKKHSYKGQS